MIEVSNLRCRNCKYYKADADMQGRECLCKRIDHKEIKFAVPWFKSYDCDFGTICSDFEPAEWQTAICREWEEVGGFAGFWPLWVDQWCPYGKTDKLVYFTLNGDTNIRYGVRMMDYVQGKMRAGNVLFAVERSYYRKHKTSEKYPTGYELVHEPIDGVKIKEGELVLKDITIEASDVWDYAQEHAEELVNISHIIASNDDYGIEVLISKDDIDDDAVYIYVEADDEEVYGKYITDRTQSAKIVKDIYDDYLTSKVLETLGYCEVNVISSDDDDDEELDKEVQVDIEDDDIQCRENDLDFAVNDFIETVTDCTLSHIFSNQQAEEILQDCKEHFLEYMARKWGIDIYRPMYLYTEKGERYFTEFPYEEMVFDDPDNPLYKNA